MLTFVDSLAGASLPAAPSSAQLACARDKHGAACVRLVSVESRLMHRAGPAHLQLGRDEERAVLERGMEVLAGFTGGQAVRGYRSPAWNLSAHTLGCVTVCALPCVTHAYCGRTSATANAYA